MEKNVNADDCDLCGNLGPCHFCKRTGITSESSTKEYIYDYMYAPSVMMAVDMYESGEIKKSVVTPNQIIDIGTMFFVRMFDCEPDDCVFGIPDMRVKDLFDVDVKRIKTSKTMTNMYGLTEIYIGLL